MWYEPETSLIKPSMFNSHTDVAVTICFCGQFQAHAVVEGSGSAEPAMPIVVNVLDQNDNKPVFAQAVFLGQVPEASPKGVYFINRLSVLS